MTAFDTFDEPNEIPPEATALLATLDQLWGGHCRDCERTYCGHEIVMSLTLGFRDAPRCLACLARGLRREPAELLAQVAQYVKRKDCYTQAWNRADEREDSCPLAEPIQNSTPVSRASSPPAEASGPVETWDAGDMSCGDLVLALRIRLNARPPGSVLEVTARDPAAPVDLPAWCGLTGHTLLHAEPPHYRIRRKET